MKIPISLLLRKFCIKLIGKINQLNGSSMLLKSDVILCYHSLSKDNWLFSINPQEFEKHITRLREVREIVKVEELFLKKPSTCLGRVAITFDDGYKNVYKIAFPILKKYSLKACVFINSSKIVNCDGSFSNRKPLSLEEIKELKRNGWDFGYHTMTHSDLRLLSLNALNQELVEGKSKLESKLGFRVDYLAYPFGVCSKKVISVVKRGGYKKAFTIAGGAVNKKDFPYQIDRMLIDRFMTNDDLNILLTNKGLFFNKLFTKILRYKDDLFLLLTQFANSIKLFKKTLLGLEIT